MAHPARLAAKGIASLAVLGLMAAAIFVLPYHLAVQPAVSQSYTAGYSNRAALLGFLVCGTALVLLFPRPPRALEGQNQHLSRWTGAVVTLGGLAVCLLWRWHRWPMLGPEALYLIERQHHLSLGQRPYRDFEFIYGPLLLLPGSWLQSLLRTSSRNAYLISLALQWTVGTAMLWFSVSRLEVRSRYRGLLLGFFLVLAFLNIFADGVNYTPLRSFCAACASVGVFLFWQRSRRPWPTVGLIALSIVCAVGLSPEQGLALSLGLSGYALFLAFCAHKSFPWSAAAAVLVVAVAAIAAAAALGIFASTRSIAAGGYNLPMLPSRQNIFLLLTYLYGLWMLADALRARAVDQVAVPVGLCGVFLLPAVFGRCDVGHVGSAVPLLLLSAFGFSQRRWSFWPWFAAAVYLLFPLSFFKAATLRHVHAATAIAEAPAPQPAPQPIPNERYFAPVNVPMDTQGAFRWNVDSGFYYGLWDVTSPATIQAKADEIRRKRAPALLLPEQHGEIALAFWPSETTPALLRSLEGSSWIPAPVHPLPSLEPVRRAITDLYEPTGAVEDNWRVWRLRTPSAKAE